MTETRTPEEAAPLISLQNVPVNSKEDLFKKKLFLGGLMLCVIMISTMIATGK